jgi:CRP/FNR family transcriptional regulator, anaerobic regulatory protein
MKFELSQQTGTSTNTDAIETRSPCADCTIRSTNICGVLLGAASGQEIAHCNGSDWQDHGEIRAHKNINSAGDRSDRVYVVCEGWAFRFAQLSDGRKQILAFMIPGDIITTTSPFDEHVPFSVQALTNVRYCGFDRSRLKAKLAADATVFDAWTKLVLAARQHTFGLVIDLGCRTADERIAHLILDLKLRLERRGAQVERRFVFPLSQRVIAAATGLTPEHVSRVMGSFRRAGLIENGNGFLRIVDLPRLQRIGGLNF